MESDSIDELAADEPTTRLEIVLVPFVCFHLSYLFLKRKKQSSFFSLSLLVRLTRNGINVDRLFISTHNQRLQLKIKLKTTNFDFFFVFYFALLATSYTYKKHLHLLVYLFAYLRHNHHHHHQPSTIIKHYFHHHNRRQDRITTKFRQRLLLLLFSTSSCLPTTSRNKNNHNHFCIRPHSFRFATNLTFNYLLIVCINWIVYIFIFIVLLLLFFLLNFFLLFIVYYQRSFSLESHRFNCLSSAFVILIWLHFTLKGIAKKEGEGEEEESRLFYHFSCFVRVLLHMPHSFNHHHHHNHQPAFNFLLS